MAYSEQLRRKTAVLDVLLRRSMGDAAPRVSPAIAMSPGSDGMPWRFRQKAAFVFGRGPDGLVMDHFARGTSDGVPVEECPVHAGRANRIAFALRDTLATAGIPAAGVGTEGLARHVVVLTSRDEKEAVAMLVATRDDPALRAPLHALLEGGEKPDGLVLILHDRPGPFLVGRESKRVAGPGHVREEALGPAFLVSPASFFQTNVGAAATVLRVVLRKLFSLFCFWFVVEEAKNANSGLLQAGGHLVSGAGPAVSEREEPPGIQPGGCSDSQVVRRKGRESEEDI